MPGWATTPTSWTSSAWPTGTVFSRRELVGASWKVCYDGYLEGYHFASLHRDTIFKQNMSNVMATDAYGPHQRIVFAKHGIEGLRDQPEEEWVPADHIGPVYIHLPPRLDRRLLG